ncbi:CASP-like protein 1f2 [Phtheirospermum japonicum]|uniref:CASP-like protein n=1 Tax=Phtheirospermum japonicum TaxID=374723 RepID=A0A830BB48_9LAMI|nr:CASP-like protein 1f2 [Phtheirospermum japonicum]
MANPIDKNLDSPPLKTRRFYYATQKCLRFLAIAITLAAAWLMVANKETAVVYGIQVDARYSYAPAFKFLAIANFIALALSVVSFLLVFILGKVALNPAHFYIFFLHDLMIALLLMAACAASTTTAYTGKYGNSHVGWMAICDHFAKFCNRGQAAIILTYLGFALYLILTLVSANKLLHLQAS